MFVLVEEAGEPIVSADMQVCDRGGIGDRFRLRLQRSRVRDAPMGSVTIVVAFVLAQRLQQVRLRRLRSTDNDRNVWALQV